MVIYATAVGASIGELFLTSYIPGRLIGLALMITAYFISMKRKYPVRKRKISFKGYIIGFKDALSALIMPIIIMGGGILGGIFTPTEAANVFIPPITFQIILENEKGLNKQISFLNLFPINLKENILN